jgi:hypothetical protein
MNKTKFTLGNFSIPVFLQPNVVQAGVKTERKIYGCRSIRK